MAEVRKAKKQVKYNIEDLENVKKEKVKTKKPTKKVEKKQNNSKDGAFAKVRIFFNGVKDETKKIHWTSKNDMIKYSTATISFIVFFALFFYLINVIFALIQSLFN